VVTESGAVTDTSVAPVVGLAASDVGAAAESYTLDSGSTPKVASESGSVVDTVVSVVVAVTVSDTSVGADTSSLLYLLAARTESGAATDVSGLANLFSVLDSATGADAKVSAPSAAFTSADSGFAVEASFSMVAVLTTKTDAGIATDAGVSMYFLLVSDAGVATDSGVTGLVPETDDERKRRQLGELILMQEFFPSRYRQPHHKIL
jgi:hypothetical protein